MQQHIDAVLEGANPSSICKVGGQSGQHMAATSIGTYSMQSANLIMMSAFGHLRLYSQLQIDSVDYNQLLT